MAKIENYIGFSRIFEFTKVYIPFTSLIIRYINLMPKNGHLGFKGYQDTLSKSETPHRVAISATIGAVDWIYLRG